MSSTYAEPLDRLEAVLDDLAGIAPEFRSTDEKQELLLRITRLIGRAEAERVGPTGTVLGYRRPPAHAGHTLMTLVTGGLWIPIWLIATSRQREAGVRLEADRWATCGAPTSPTAELVRQLGPMKPGWASVTAPAGRRGDPAPGRR